MRDKLRYIFCLVFGLIWIPLASGSAGYNWPHTEELRKDIEFWKKVFTVYGKDQAIFHDADNLEIVYKVITFNDRVSEADREASVDKTKSEIRKSLLRLAAHFPAQENRTNFEQYLLGLFGDSANSDRLRQAAENIRSQQGLREIFFEGRKRSAEYLPEIKSYFREQGLPEELAYLPHLESSFNPLARSRVGAAGMWQFMRSTGKLYMKVNRIVDQRYDPLISSRAASRLLKYNFSRTGNWPLAMTAYNFGLAGMLRAMRKHGSEYLQVRNSFHHRRFQFASRNFYPEFLAIVEIIREMGPQPVSSEKSVATYRLKTAVKLKKLARSLNISVEELKKLNPSYRRWAWQGFYSVPAGYWIYLPQSIPPEKLIANFEIPDIPEPAYAEAEEFADPQSLSRIISRKKPGVADWTRHLNRLSAVLPANVSLSPDELVDRLRYKLAVRKGKIEVFTQETLGHYADWLRVPIRELQRINGLGHRRTIYQGQILRLSFRRVSPEKFSSRRLNYHLSTLNQLFAAKSKYVLVEHQVRPGESVWQIQQNRSRVPVELIQYFNFDVNLNKLHPGDKLRIPVFNSNQSTEETL